MEFFNKKEQVIDLQITQFGRHLLSKGAFIPVYYSFFDDNVIYNSNNAGYTEKQNEAEDRINVTQTMRPQISFSSLEKEFGNNYNLILSGKEEVGGDTIQKTAEKNYSLTQPLGASDINSEYVPSWTVQFLNGSLSGSVGHKSLVDEAGGTNNVLIPQLSSHTRVKTINLDNIEEDSMLGDEFEEGLISSKIAVTSSEDDLFVLLKVSEFNGFFQKKNYDVEFFEILEQEESGVTTEVLRPLTFSEHHDPENELGFMDETDPEEDVTNTEYYFDILVDEEIDDELLCKLDPSDETLGAFADPRAELCQELLNKQKKKVFNIYDDGADTPGDIC